MNEAMEAIAYIPPVNVGRGISPGLAWVLVVCTFILPAVAALLKIVIPRLGRRPPRQRMVERRDSSQSSSRIRVNWHTTPPTVERR